MSDELIKKQLERIENLLMGQKDVFTFDECCQYTRISKTYMYKLTSANKIPFSKPNGKTIYFSREEIDKWLLQNPVKTLDQIEREASTYIVSRRRKR